MTEKLYYHEELAENYKIYQAFDDFTKGMSRDVRKYLIQYQTEKAENPQAKLAFANRLERLFNVNYCSPYLFIHLGHLSQVVTINMPNNNFLEPILEDSTQFGNDYNEVFRDLLWYYLRDGKVGCLVDKESQSEGLTESQRKTLNLRSYQVIYEAEDIRNYAYHLKGSLKGKLSFVDLCDGYDSDGKDHYEKVLRLELLEGSTAYSWKKLKATSSKKSEDISTNEGEEFEVYDEGIGALPEVPFVIFGNGAEDSFISTIIEMNKALLNKRSVKDNIIHYQAFQRSFATGVKPEELGKVGESIITALENEKASILTIPPGDTVAVENEMAEIRNELSRHGKLEFNQLADDTRQVQSSQSKSKDTQAKVKIYDTVIKLFENKLRKVYQLHALFDGGLSFDISSVSVSISRDYNLDDSQEETFEDQATFAMARELGAEDVQKAILKKRIQNLKIVPDNDLTEDETLKKLIDSIDAAAPQSQSGISDLFAGINNTTVS